MTSATQTAAGYIAAWTTGDIDAALALVSDDFRLRTAMETSHGKQALRGALEHFAPLARGAHIRQQFAADSDVCTVIELDIALPTVSQSLLITEVDHVSDGRLTDSLLVFDSAAFRGNPATTVLGELVDPVCGMTVQDATAPAYEYDDQEYRFCSASCANAFKEHPERYRQASA
ncbi:MAG: YHS domain-containing protein [Solirubrobacteraceae bacterium]